MKGLQMVTKNIPVSAIIFPSDDIALRPRPKESDKDYQTFIDLKESLREKGLINIFSVRQDGENYCVIDGNRRASAVVELFNEGDPQFTSGIVVQIREEEEYEALASQIAANHNMKKTLSSQEIKALKRIMAIKNWSLEETSKHVSMTPTYVANLLKLNYLPESAKSALDEKQLTIANAIQLQKLPEDAIDDEWITKAMTMPGAEFTAAISEELNRLKKERQLGKEAMPREFTATAKLLAKDDLTILLARTQSAYEVDPNDYNRGAYETMQKVFQLDEKTVAAKKAEWEKAEAAREKKSEERKAEREARKLADAQALLEAAGKKVA